MQVTLGFNPIVSKSGPDGKALPENVLVAERNRFQAALDGIDAKVADAQLELLQPKHADEQEIWETKLITLQVEINVLPACHPQGRLLVCAAHGPPDVPGQY